MVKRIEREYKIYKLKSGKLIATVIPQLGLKPITTITATRSSRALAKLNKKWKSLIKTNKNTEVRNKWV